jgi:hypothetical protein
MRRLHREYNYFFGFCLRLWVRIIDNMADELMNDRLATFYYKPDGKKATAQIWEETMKELDFAHVKEIIASMK